MSHYIGSLDQGTTSTRFMIFDRAGGVVASHQLEHRQIYPNLAGWSMIPGDLAAGAASHGRGPGPGRIDPL